MTWWHDQRYFQLFCDRGLLDLYIFASHVCYALYMTMSTVFACMWHELSSHILTIHFYICTETTQICTELCIFLAYHLRSVHMSQYSWISVNVAFYCFKLIKGVRAYGHVLGSIAMWSWCELTNQTAEQWCHVWLSTLLNALYYYCLPWLNY